MKRLSIFAILSLLIALFVCVSCTEKSNKARNDSQKSTGFYPAMEDGGGGAHTDKCL